MKFLNLDSYKRLTVQPTEVEALDTTLRLDDFYENLKPIEIVRPEFWRFCSPTSPERDARHPDFLRYDPQSVVAPSDAHVEAWLDAAVPCYEKLASSAGNPDTKPRSLDPYLQSEYGVWKKLTVQRGVDIGFFLEPTSPGAKGPNIPGSFFDAAAIVLRAYRRAASSLTQRELLGLNPDPVDTNSGFPLFTKGALAKFAGAMLWRPRFQDTLEAGRDWARAFGVPDAAAMANGVGTRTGPMYKKRNEWFRDESGAWLANTTYKGGQSRNRVVQMSSVAVNMACRPWFAWLHGARTVLQGLWRTGAEDSILHTGYAYNYEADISGYDASVTLPLQAAVYQVVRSEWPEIAGDCAVWLMAEQLPLVGPSFNRDPRLCSIIPAIAGTSSGLKPTAEIGTLICAMCTAYALSQIGVSIKNWPHIPGVVVSHQGDDIRISSHTPLNNERFTEIFAEMGLKCELIPGYTFLSKHLTPTGAQLPVAGRLVQQTMSNEHEPRGRWAAGLALLGFQARFVNYDLHPTWMTDAVWSCVKHADWIATRGLTSIGEVIAYATSDPGRRLIAQAVSASASETWIEQVMRNAEHSSTDREILRTIRQLGIMPGDLMSMRRVIRDRIAASMSWSPDRKRSVLLRITDALMKGPMAYEQMETDLKLGKEL